MRLATELTNNIIESIVDGEGVRLVLFTQGCIHRCKGCHNKSTWDLNGGYEYSINDIVNELILRYRKAKSFYSGITISGGDPLCQQEDLYEMIKAVKKEEPNINIWLYTGYDTDDVYNNYSDIISLIDVVVTGKYIESEKTLSKKFVGSLNQEIVRLK